MSTPYLINTRAREKEKRHSEYYNVAALCRLKNGASFSQDNIYTIWKHPTIKPPSIITLKEIAPVSKIKWYIWNKTEELAKEFSWSHNFLLGLSECGHVIQRKYDMPRFLFSTVNKRVRDLFEISPYHCNISTTTARRYSISDGGFFCMKEDKQSMEYIAGVLASGEIEKVDKNIYVRYPRKIAPFLNEWKIPIDIEYKRGGADYVYISPIWPTLLKKYMPSEEAARWIRFKHPAKSEEYAFILWRIYVDKDPQSGAFPYLKGRMTMYNHYATMKNFNQKWLDYKLVELDRRFQRAILEWKKEFDNGKKIEKNSKDDIISTNG
jgi:hypothetical protein